MIFGIALTVGSDAMARDTPGNSASDGRPQRISGIVVLLIYLLPALFFQLLLLALKL